MVHANPSYHLPQEELDLKGIAHIGGPADADKKVELKPGMLLEQDPDVSGNIEYFARYNLV